MLKLSRRGQVLTAGLFALVVLVAVVSGLVRYNREVEADAEAGQRAQQDYRVSTAEERHSAETRVTILGDTFAGTAGSDAGATWPQQLAGANEWTLDLEDVAGTGYMQNSSVGTALGGRLDRVPRRYADLIVFALGASDIGLDVSDVKATARKAIEDVHDITPSSDLVILSPFCNDTANISPQFVALREALKAVAKEEGVPYIDVTRFIPASAIGPDGVHPTDEGHTILADKIGAALKQLELPKALAWRQK